MCHTEVYEYFEDKDSVSQIMELESLKLERARNLRPCYGGELQERINDVFQCFESRKRHEELSGRVSHATPRALCAT